ncbi:MAG: 50S ribosome-binding GTPase [Firmicutes bacterium]|nr:50S ribosome-binding GTPase [Bacillota bacterium]MCL5038864.1 50S ribosome-binding GTPase [Bacillota bacterium]
MVRASSLDLQTGMEEPGPSDSGLSPDPVIALVGNPNTGKTTLFNALTGLNQHTGNWPGKTVSLAQGSLRYRGKRFGVVDLPGTYSLLANSPEEEVARDYLCFGSPNATVVVTDATCLERNLNLVLQVMEITPKVIVAVNLIDEAQRKGISIETGRLAEELGLPVVPISARLRRGLPLLLDRVDDLISGRLTTSPRCVRYDPQIEEAIRRIQEELPDLGEISLNPRWLALRLLEGEVALLEKLRARLGNNLVTLCSKAN